jgi:hypothetical protein
VVAGGQGGQPGQGHLVVGLVPEAEQVDGDGGVVARTGRVRSLGLTLRM